MRGKDGPVELRGNLRDFNLPDVIQLVGFGRKTGVLRVECPVGEAALFFEEGTVVHAEYPGIDGVDAVYQLLSVPEGEFRFHKEVEPPSRTITMDSTNLLMEAARLLDESRREEATGADFEAESGDGDWIEFGEKTRDPQEIKQEIKALVRERFGRGSKRLEQAVDRCGDSVEELLDLAARMEKYVQIFLDTRASGSLGQEIRGLITGPSFF